MKGGRLDRRIIVQVKAETVATNMQRTLQWSTFLTIWSNPVQKDGVEKTDNENRSTKRMVNFRVRYNSTITNEMRIIWEGNYYKIEDIKELGRQDGLMINTSLLTQT